MKRNISLFAGVIILAYLIVSLDPGRILFLLANIKVSFFLAALAINFVDEVVAARILYVVLRRPDIAFKDVFLSHISGMMYSDITPARIGYYYTALSLSRKLNTKKTVNIGVVTAIHGVIFLTKTLGCLLGILYFSYVIGRKFGGGLFYAATIVPAAGFLGVIAFLYTRLPQNILAKFPKLQGLVEYVTSIQEAVGKMGRRDFNVILSLTLLIWLLVGIQWYLLALAIGVPVRLLDAILMRPLLSAVGFIPLTPNGLGLAEGGGAILFAAIGFTATEGLTFVLLTRINQLMINALGLLDLRRR